MVQGFGFRVWDLGFYGIGFMVKGFGFRAYGVERP